MTPRRPLLARVLLAIALAVAAGALVWPGPQLFTERIEPRIAGLPFAFAWDVAWLIAVFAAVLAYHLWTGEEG